MIIHSKFKNHDPRNICMVFFCEQFMNIYQKLLWSFLYLSCNRYRLITNLYELWHQSIKCGIINSYRAYAAPKHTSILYSSFSHWKQYCWKIKVIVNKVRTCDSSVFVQKSVFFQPYIWSLRLMQICWDFRKVILLWGGEWYWNCNP